MIKREHDVSYSMNQYVTISHSRRQKGEKTLDQMNVMYKSRIILTALSLLILSFTYPAAGNDNFISGSTTEILAEQDGPILVTTNVTGNRLVLKENLPTEVIFKITNANGGLILTGKSTDRVVYLKGLSKGSYFIEINLDGEPIKQMFSVLY